MDYREMEAFYRNRMGVQRENTVKLLAENSRYKQRRKGERILVEGEDMVSVIFHLSGAAECYVYDTNGRKCVMGFCKDPGGACIGAPGVQEKIDFTVEALTDMEILELPIQTLVYAIKHDPEVAEIYHQMLILDHDVDYEWQIALQTKNGTERYQWFLERFADIESYVPKKDVASFLCLKPQSLSRIRSSLKKRE